MADVIDAHPRGRYGGVDDDMAALGPDPDAVADRFSGYRERFVAR